MNRGNIKILYDRLLLLQKTGRERRFRMDIWTGPPVGMEGMDGGAEFFHADPERCGTAACLGGWAALIVREQSGSKQFPSSIDSTAGRWLGLTLTQRNWWFSGRWHPSWGRHRLAQITLADALVFLGKVLDPANRKVRIKLDEADLTSNLERG
jgi:hypothetical protein